MVETQREPLRQSEDLDDGGKERRAVHFWEKRERERREGGRGRNGRVGQGVNRRGPGNVIGVIRAGSQRRSQVRARGDYEKDWGS